MRSVCILAKVVILVILAAFFARASESQELRCLPSESTSRLIIVVFDLVLSTLCPILSFTPHSVFPRFLPSSGQIPQGRLSGPPYPGSGRLVFDRAVFPGTVSGGQADDVTPAAGGWTEVYPGRTTRAWYRPGVPCPPSTTLVHHHRHPPCQATSPHVTQEQEEYSGQSYPRIPLGEGR